MIEQVMSVSELIDTVNIALAEEVVVEGEISRIDVRQGNLAFITLVDETGAVDVFGLAFRLKNLDALTPGMLVRVFGTPGLYKKSGRFRIDANAIVPSGDGALRIAFERLKLKLETEGLFDIERKRAIIRFPQKIALITAPKSQAYNDFIKVLRERFGGIHIDFYPTKLQGIGAESAIAKALQAAAQGKIHYDALILVRGGGSQEDLAAFNSEEVARAVFASRFPVIAGVGHEGDISLADLVADLRASTPSNAAELLAPERESISQEIEYSLTHIEQKIADSFRNAKTLIDSGVTLAQDALTLTQRNLRESEVKIFELEKNIQFQISQQRSSVLEHVNKMFHATDHALELSKNKTTTLERILSSINPEKVLARGYSIIRSENGTIVTNAKDTEANQIISATLHHGIIKARVIQHEPKK